MEPLLIDYLFKNNRYYCPTYVGLNVPEYRNKVRDDLRKSNVREISSITAILDSGIMTSHPLISKWDFILAMKDFTGEGIEDQSGHGTVIALLRQTLIPDEYRKRDTLIAKVLDKNGQGFEDEIIQGIDWALENGATLFNLSFGIERHSPCNGGCRICSHMKSITSKNNDVIFFASLPNKRNAYHCPSSDSSNLENVQAIGMIKNSEGENPYYDIDKDILYGPGEIGYAPLIQK